MKLVDLLKNVDPRYENDVKSICNKWKKKVQESLKDMMRFSMAKDIKILFDVNIAYPENISLIEFTDLEYQKFMLFQYRNNTLQLRNYYSLFCKLYNKTYPSDELSESNLEYVGKLIDNVLNETPKDDEFFNKIRNIDSDILGVYRIPQRFLKKTIVNLSNYGSANINDNMTTIINLFWSVIGLFSERYNLNIEAVTVAVLSHEYAHAYSHVGVDANECYWSSLNFVETDIKIKEGLAEYFSKKFMYDNDDHLNKFSEVYNILLDKSPQIYKEYLNWENPSLEALRFAMLQVRNNNNITSYNEFLQILKDGKKRYPN